MPAKLSINLNYLKHNIQIFKNYLLADQELTVMVKADAYGAGIVETTKCLEKEGINHFGVAYLKEAVLLRKNGIKGEIVFILEGKSAIDTDGVNEDSNKSNVELVKEYIKLGLSKNDAIKKVAKEKGVTKNEVYMECVNENEGN